MYGKLDKSDSLSYEISSCLICTTDNRSLVARSSVQMKTLTFLESTAHGNISEYVAHCATDVPHRNKHVKRGGLELIRHKLGTSI